MTIPPLASTSRLTRLLSTIVLVPPLTAGALSPAAAQSAQVLPGIVVEGATLEEPPARPAKPAVSSGASAVPTNDAPEAASVQQEAASTSVADAAEAGVPATQLGTAVTVVTGEELRRQQVRHAADALRSLPGVSVNRTGAPAGLTQVRIRGADANHTLVLIDGIEANAGSDGTFDFSDLLTEDIERIEVIRGPQSALYGSNAVGGVINIVTRSGKGPLRVTASTEGGSFGAVGGAARISGGNDRAWGAATVQHRRSEGFNIAPEGPLGEDDGYRITSLSASAGAMLADNIRLDLNIRRSSKDLDRDDETGLNSRDGWIISSDSFSRYKSTVLLMGADLRWDTFGGDLTHLFKAARNLTTRDDVMIADFGGGFGPPLPVDTTDNAYKFSYQSTYRFNTPVLGVRHAITGLVDHGRESVENQTNSGFVEAARKQTGVALEWRGDFFNRVFLSAGLRHDDNDTFDDFTTWRTGISVPIPELGIRPHASAGTGVRVPTLFEQFGSTPFFVSNPDLKPEESKGWDAGVEFTFLRGKAVVDVTYFATDLINMIDGDSTFVPCPTSPWGCTFPVNLPGTSERKGVEISGRFVLMPNLSLGLSYTYLEAVDAEGKREVRRPDHAARADLAYGFHDGRGEISLAVVYNGQTENQVLGAPFFFPVGRVTLDDYWLVSAAASYKLRDDLEVYGRVENLFDEEYEEVFGFSTAGTAAYAGLRWKFDLDRPVAGLAMK
jgi:vitamin B12 transporter